MNKVFKTGFIILKTIIILFLVIIALLICMQRFSNNSFSLFSYRMFGVVTSSMVPKYQVGDVLLCKEVDANTLLVGDDISYLGKYGSMEEKIITHQIIKVMKDEDTGKLLFQTKGIATTNPDPIIDSSQVYGKIVKKLSILSFIYKIMSTKMGFYLVIFIPLAILVGSEIVISMVENYSRKRLKHSKE